VTACARVGVVGAGDGAAAVGLGVDGDEEGAAEDRNEEDGR